MRIHSFSAIRPPATRAAEVASQPYDVLDTARALELVADNPASFLRVVRPEVDLPAGTDLYDDTVYEKARENFLAFQRDGLLVQDKTPGLYAYRLTMGEHSQTGLVTTCHIDDYEQNVIRKHEFTLKKKEDDRTRHVATLEANAGPVFLTYRDQPDVDRMMREVEAGEPDYDFTAADGVRHAAWRIGNTEPWVDAFAAIPTCYVADGHHRTASAARVGRERREANPHHRGDEAYNWFLTVLFPATQLQVLAYNRVVKDLNGLDAAAFLDAVRKEFDVAEDAAPIPASPHTISMYLSGTWYGLTWQQQPDPDPVTSLDVSVLQRRVLDPLLGIDDPKTNPRIGFVGGIHGAEGLQNQVDAGDATVAFSLYPTRVDELMAIADADLIMPPKST